MKRIKEILLFIFLIIIFTSCQTSKSIQRQMQGIQSELFYELTTPVYSENINNTIYLSHIEDSVSISYTTVEKKGSKVFPFIFYNHVQNKHEITLGNSSLIQPYNEFLMDALLAQCNRSTCFELKEIDDAVLPDSALILEVKVNKNRTSVDLIQREILCFIPITWYFMVSFTDWNVNKPVSWLEISARLIQQEKCLWEETYAVTKDFHYKQQRIALPFLAYEICIDNMTECLSYATKDVVENISQNLHLLMLAR